MQVHSADQWSLHTPDQQAQVRQSAGIAPWSWWQRQTRPLRSPVLSRTGITCGMRRHQRHPHRYKQGACQHNKSTSRVTAKDSVFEVSYSGHLEGLSLLGISMRFMEAERRMRWNLREINRIRIAIRDVVRDGNR